MSPTIHHKYKYFHSTVQRAKDRRQKFHFCHCRLTYNHQLNLSISARSWIIWKSHSRLDPILDMRSCLRAIKQVPTRAKRPASIRTYIVYSLWKGDVFPLDHFTGYKKSNQNQFGRVLPFAFALTCYKIYFLVFSLNLILIHSADACILVMACVDCACACS